MKWSDEMKNILNFVFGVPTGEPESTDSYEIKAKVGSDNVIQMDIKSLRKSKAVINQATKAQKFEQSSSEAL